MFIAAMSAVEWRTDKNSQDEQTVVVGCQIGVCSPEKLGVPQFGLKAALQWTD